MHSYFVPKPPYEPVTDTRPRRTDTLHRAMRRAQRVFLAVNAMPLAVGILLSCAAEAAAAPVYGRLTLGLVWGILQLGVFVASAWWYEVRSTRACDRLEQSSDPGVPLTGALGASPADASWR